MCQPVGWLRSVCGANENTVIHRYQMCLFGRAWWAVAAKPRLWRASNTPCVDRRCSRNAGAAFLTDATHRGLQESFHTFSMSVLMGRWGQVVYIHGVQP